jgi:hypothetical protein
MAAPGDSILIISMITRCMGSAKRNVVHAVRLDVTIVSVNNSVFPKLHDRIWIMRMLWPEGGPSACFAAPFIGEEDPQGTASPGGSPLGFPHSIWKATFLKAF